MSRKSQDKTVDSMHDTMNVPLYSTRIVRTFLEYLAKHYPHISRKALLESADITDFEIEDPAHYLTQEQINRFHQQLMELTNNPGISREAGRYATSAEVLGTMKKHLMGIMSLALMYEIAGKNVENLSRHITFKTKKLGPYSIEVRATQRPGVHEEPFQCENRMGSLESLARLRTSSYAHIEHPQCIHRGDPQCRYIVSWEPTTEMKLRKIRYTMLFICSLWLVFSFSVFPASAWGIASLATIVMAIATIGYTGHIEKKTLRESLDSQSRSAYDLLDKTNRLYNNALLIQEIGQATTTVMPVHDLCRSVTGILRKYLDFDCGMVLLADERREQLVSAAEYGFSGSEPGQVGTTVFPMTDTAPGDPVTAPCLDQRPVLINDTTATYNPLPEDLKDFFPQTAHLFVHQCPDRV
ncbi:MAG TPA: hypothetical protein ENN05_03695 [Deltaproteobacteria bacterium]|nr:hypothetical protein [Deltaproteobacteria bacterium]